MAVKACRPVAVLNDRTCPDVVEAVLEAIVERAVAGTLVEGYEERRSRRSESIAVQNVGNETVEVAVAPSYASAASGRSATVRTGAAGAHVVAIVRSEPHEVGSRGYIVEVVD